MIDFNTYVASKPATVRRIYKLKSGYRNDLVSELSTSYPLIMQVELWNWQPDMAMFALESMGITEIKNWTPSGPGNIKIPVTRDPAAYPKNPEPSIRWLVRTDSCDEMGRYNLGDEATFNGNPFDANFTIHFTDRWGFECAESVVGSIKWLFRVDWPTRQYWFERMS